MNWGTIELQVQSFGGLQSADLHVRDLERLALHGIELSIRDTHSLLHTDAIMLILPHNMFVCFKGCIEITVWYNWVVLDRRVVMEKIKKKEVRN